jgi:hypothetical protein
MSDFLKSTDRDGLIARLEKAATVAELDRLLEAAAGEVRKSANESPAMAMTRLLNDETAVYETYDARRTALLRKAGVAAA